MAHIGRLWQINKYGQLINDADAGYIQPPYRALVDDVIRAYIEHIGQDVHSIYLTGSVSRGLAVEGLSDLNAIAVLEYYTDPELVMRDWVAPTEQALLARHPCVSDIEMEIWTHGWLLHDESAFSISAFILKSHAVCVWGADVTPDLTDYRFTNRETRIAIANDDIVQLLPDIEDAIDAIQADRSAVNVADWCKRVCKNMIHSAFGLVMVDEAVHTRDIDLSVDYFLRYYPDQRQNIQQAVDWIKAPPHSVPVILEFLDTFGMWLIDECDRWLDQYNPERYLEYPFELDEAD